MVSESHIDMVLEIFSERKKLTWNVLRGSSMAPLIRHGDTVIIRHGIKRFNSGDILVYRNGDKLCAHRLMKIQKVPEGVFFIFKGDNCLFMDQPIARDLIVGKIVAARNKNGTLKFDTAFWRLANYVLAKLSFASARCRSTDSKHWRIVRKILGFNSSICLNGNSHWRIFLRMLAKFSRREQTIS